PAQGRRLQHDPGAPGGAAAGAPARRPRGAVAGPPPGGGEAARRPRAGGPGAGRRAETGPRGGERGSGGPRGARARAALPIGGRPLLRFRLPSRRGIGDRGGLRALERSATVAIVGVGLIGGSIGLALRARGLADRVIGIGRDETRLAEALMRGAIDEPTTDL